MDATNGSTPDMVRANTVQIWVSTEAKLTGKGVDITSKSTLGLATELDRFSPNELLYIKTAGDTVAMLSMHAARSLLDDLDGRGILTAEAVDGMVALINRQSTRMLSAVFNDDVGGNDADVVITEPVVDDADDPF